MISSSWSKVGTCIGWYVLPLLLLLDIIFCCQLSSRESEFGSGRWLNSRSHFMKYKLERVKTGLSNWKSNSIEVGIRSDSSKFSIHAISCPSLSAWFCLFSNHRLVHHSAVCWVTIMLTPRTTPREAKGWVGLINKHRSLTLEARDESAKRRHTGFSF